MDNLTTDQHLKHKEKRCRVVRSPGALSRAPVTGSIPGQGKHRRQLISVSLTSMFLSVLLPLPFLSL